MPSAKLPGLEYDDDGNPSYGDLSLQTFAQIIQGDKPGRSPVRKRHMRSGWYNLAPQPNSADSNLDLFDMIEAQQREDAILDLLATLPVFECPGCGNVRFRPKGTRRRYCSEQCAWRTRQQRHRAKIKDGLENEGSPL
jgi:hypothetical protein